LAQSRSRMPRWISKHLFTFGPTGLAAWDFPTSHLLAHWHIGTLAHWHIGTTPQARTSLPFGKSHMWAEDMKRIDYSFPRRSFGHTLRSGVVDRLK
jgi:hypothetical protein